MANRTLAAPLVVDLCWLGRLTVMRFSCAPPERGGQRNKGSEHVLSIAENHAAQHGQRPVADRRQRQLQTLVRLQAARSIQFRPFRQQCTALR